MKKARCGIYIYIYIYIQNATFCVKKLSIYKFHQKSFEGRQFCIVFNIMDIKETSLLIYKMGIKCIT